MRVRPPREEDLDEVLALLQAADATLIGGSDWTAPDLRDEWEEVADLGEEQPKLSEPDRAVRSPLRARRHERLVGGGRLREGAAVIRYDWSPEL